MGVAEPPTDSTPRDHVSILGGASQNIVGMVVAAGATFAAQILITRTLGAEGFGIVTIVTQAAFVLSFVTRAGMDMAVLRDVAIDVGEGRLDRARVPVARGALVAFAVSTVVAAAGLFFADSIRAVFSLDPSESAGAVEAAAAGLPFIALTNVWLSATRGLKIMRYTLYVFWAGQPLLWLLLMAAGWSLAREPWTAVAAYSASWAVAAAAAGWFWRKESRAWEASPMGPGALTRLMRYAGPRAPAALFSQLLFWTDLFVLTRYADDVEVGIYSAALRAGQMVVLFLTSVSLMFSPFVADLHNRGETERLDRLFKSLTRWTLAATLPAFLVLVVAPGPVLRIFGAEFAGGRAALLVLLGGQLVNIATGSVGFVLIMVGRTGWDLLVYAGSLIMNLGLAFWLCPRYGMEGAAAANAVTFAASKWARLALVRRFVGIQPYDAHYWRLLPAAGAGLAAMWGAHAVVAGGWALDLTATAAAGGLAYVLVYLAVGLTPSERDFARWTLARLRGR